jgi:hypothetical protein
MKRKNFAGAFDILKHRIIDNNLSIEEVSENAEVSEELVELLMNPDSDVVNSIERLFKSLKVNLYIKELKFEIYKLRGEGNQFKVTRIINPKCSIYFDKSTQEFYRFREKYKRDKLSRARKQLIMSEMKEFLENRLK